MVQYFFTSTETRRLVRTDSSGRPPRLTQLLKDIVTFAKISPQKKGRCPLYYHRGLGGLWTPAFSVSRIDNFHPCIKHHFIITIAETGFGQGPTLKCPVDLKKEDVRIQLLTVWQCAWHNPPPPRKKRKGGEEKTNTQTPHHHHHQQSSVTSLHTANRGAALAVVAAPIASGSVNKLAFYASQPVTTPVNHSSGAVWESRWTSWAVRPNEPSGFRGRKDLLHRASALVTTCP